MFSLPRLKRRRCVTGHRWISAVAIQRNHKLEQMAEDRIHIYGKPTTQQLIQGHYRINWMKRVLVIGATGNVGRQVVSQLTTTGAQVRAMTRKPDAARLPPQVEVMRGDLTFPDTLDR